MADTGLGQWRKLEISIPDFPADTLADIIGKIKEFVEALATTLDLILSILQVIADPIVEAIRAIIELLKETVESLLADAGMYMMYVPIRKRLMTNFMVGGDSLGDITPPLASKLGVFGQPESADGPDVTEFMVNANRSNGGNVGFYKTVVESLYDKGDTSRPQFTSEHDYMAGLTLVMGTNVDMLGFLDDLQKLRNMFGFGVDSGTTPKVPRPQGLKGRALMKPVNKKVDIYLDWDPVEVPIVKLTDLGGLSLYPSRIAILRIRDDVAALASKSIEDIMGTTRINEGDVFGPAEVISLGSYSTFMDVAYIDKGVEVEGDETLYYAVAWELSAVTGGDDLPDFTGKEGVPSEVEDPTHYWQISNIARVVSEPVLPDAAAPNWHRTPSVADIFPSFARFLRLVVAEIEKIANRFTSSLDVLLDYVAFLKEEVNRYEAIVQKILTLLQQIAYQFQMPTAGVYGRLWKGRGGNTYFLSDLAQSLSDTYPDSPPFHEGDEYVTGVVMLAGGPAPDVEAFMAGISLLFGQASENVNTLIESLDDQVSRMEDIQFGDDMEVGDPTLIDEFTDSFESVQSCTPEEPGEIVFTDTFETERVVPE